MGRLFPERHWFVAVLLPLALGVVAHAWTPPSQRIVVFEAGKEHQYRLGAAPTTRPPRIVFLHGRLEAEAHEEAFPPPSELYAGFCRELVEQLPGGGSDQAPSLWIVEYDDLLAKDLRHEPRSLKQWGRIVSSVAESLEASLRGTTTALGGDHDDETDQSNHHHNNITLVSFSMGAAIALKLLAREEHPLARSVDRFVCIGPVWRCWSSWNERTEHLSGVRALAVVGTHDEEAGTDSGGSVGATLGRLLPNLTVQTLEGGNHWAILESRLPLAGDRLEAPHTPDSVKQEISNRIVAFCRSGDESG